MERPGLDLTRVTDASSLRKTEAAFHLLAVELGTILGPPLLPHSPDLKQASLWSVLLEE